MRLKLVHMRKLKLWCLYET